MLMTNTLAALIGAMALVNTPSPAWQSDYATAYAQASTAHKPLAVFIGHGSGGAAALVAKGLNEEESKLLSAKYIPVYIDADSAQGKSLATAFQINEGLVISDATGGLQALKHGGNVSHEDLTTYLAKYSDPARPVTTTDVGGTLKTTTTSYSRYLNFGTTSTCPNCRN